MPTQELKTNLLLALVISTRMLGLFMIVPVIAILARHLEGFSPITVGIAIGGYGFSQALLQPLMGWLSDKLGRKTVIISGLLIFIAGSFIAAFSDTMNGIIIGRIIQGLGAISSATIALVCDLTQVQFRTRAMAIIGASIGLSFCFAMLLGPVIGSWGGLSALFFSNALLAGIAIIIVLYYIPTPKLYTQHLHTHIDVSSFHAVLKNRNLIGAMGGIFTLHFILMAIFTTLPEKLELAGYIAKEHSIIYMIAMLISLPLSVLLVLLSERKKLNKSCKLAAIALLLGAYPFLFTLDTGLYLVFGVTIFFSAFNFLEASLPATVGKIATIKMRGTAMGGFSTCQFLGAAVGGSLGGWALSTYGSNGVLLICSSLTIIWWLYSFITNEPAPVKNIVIALYSHDLININETGEKITAIPGVEEVVIVKKEKIAYLKVDKVRLNQAQLDRYNRNT